MDFVRLLENLAREHHIPPPVFVPAQHPIPGRFAFLCQYSGEEAMGGGRTVMEARNSAARQIWLELGHMITIDPRYCFFLEYLCQLFALLL
jgi:hypothetical protein